MTTLLTIMQPLILLVLSPLFVGCVRKAKARLQNRVGASVFLPYWSLASLLRKDMTVPEWSSWVYHAVPFVVLSSALILVVMIPLFSLGLVGNAANVFFLAGVLTLGAIFLVMGGMDTGSTFGNMGSSREMTLAALIEPALFIAFSAFALLAGSWTVDGIIAGVVHLSWPALAPLALAGAALLFAGLLENARYPVDNPATHLELTMVHEAMLLEYSGTYLAMLEYASMIKLAAWALLIAHIAVPFYFFVPGEGLGSLALSFCLVLAKLLVAAFGIALIETVVVKMRFYRMQEYTFLAFLFAFAGLAGALIILFL